jgi:dTDP-4-dehydrorhamnose 3,5-epimerase
MKLILKKTLIPGCYELQPNVFRDERGLFVKTFHEDVFKENGLETHFAEEYYSFSHKRVLRGLHFQLPPMEHVKLVYCVYGRVLDTVVDLRVGSPAYGDFETFELSDEQANMVYIPKGLAHGFYVLSESAIVMYKVTTVYSPEHDTGILWNSADIPWPDEGPIVSKRDSEFIACKNFNSPFVYKEEGSR